SGSPGASACPARRCASPPARAVGARPCWSRRTSRRRCSTPSPGPADGIPGVLPGPLAPGLLEAGGDRVAVDRVVLRPLAFDLDRAHHAAEPGATQPVPTAGEPVEQAAAIRVAASGRIDGAAHRRRRDLLAAAAMVELGTFAALGDDQGVDFAGDRFMA